MRVAGAGILATRARFVCEGQHLLIAPHTRARSLARSASTPYTLYPVPYTLCPMPYTLYPPRAEDDDDGERIQGVQAHVPLRSGMEYPRKGKPLTPMWKVI